MLQVAAAASKVLDEAVFFHLAHPDSFNLNQFDSFSLRISCDVHATWLDCACQRCWENTPSSPV